MSLANGLGSVGVPNGVGPSANGGFGPANPPPPPLSLGSGPPQQGPSVLQILAIGQERNHAADSIAHHPRMESLIKLGKESEQTWIQIGHTAEALGDLERAIASYESALRHNAYSIVALSQIAAICRSKEEFKKAAEYFGRVVGIAPESGDVWGALGHCFLMIDDLKKAYSSYQQALYYMPNPQEPKLWYGIGILYDRYGSLEHAEEAFSSVIRMDPNFEKANEIFFRLGIIYKQQRRSAQSLECFQYILKNPPRPLTEIDIWFQIGHVHEQQKDYIAAKESYERVLAENPQHAKVLQQLGGLYHRSQAPFYNPDLSVTILTKSLESDPNDPFSWYLLGRAYMTSSNFGKAYEAYQQAVYRDGKNPAFWCSIGVLYYNINQFHDALDAYSRAIRIHPYLAEVWFNLGALYESCNDQMTDAIDAYQRTLQLDPSNTIVSQRLREIRDHQNTGQPLSTPPQPKDISPSSLSWNFATNSGGGPGQLAQGGLVGAELSPAMSRSGGAGSPANGHRFDGPPPAAVRPHSTDPYRAGPGPIDARRGSNGERHGPPGGIHHSPSTSIDHSPRIGNRHAVASGAAHLPGIRHTQEVRGSPTMPDPRRGSPVSPRTRGPLGAGMGMGSEHAKAAAYEDDWRRPAPSGAPSGSAFNSPRPNGGPPGFEDPRYQSGPSYAGQSNAYGPGEGNPTLRRFGGEREREREVGPPPHPMDDEPRRRSSASTAGGRQDGSPRAPHPHQPEPQHAQLPPIPAQPSIAPSPVLPKAKVGRVKREDESSPRAGPAGRGRKSDASATSVGAPPSNGSGVGSRKEKKAAGPAKGRKSAPTNGHGHSPAPSSPAPVSPIPAPVAAPVQTGARNREVDEEYDEGVDALMGLAASAGSVSPQQPAVAPIVAAAAALAAEPTVEAVPVSVEVEQPAAVVAPAAAVGSPESENPRKRTLDSPALGEAAKRPKPSEEVDELAGESPEREAEEVPGAGEVVAAAVPVEVEVTPVPVSSVPVEVASVQPEVVAEPVAEPEAVAVEAEKAASPVPVAVPAAVVEEEAVTVAPVEAALAESEQVSPVVEQVAEVAAVEAEAGPAVPEGEGEKPMEVEEGELAA